MSGSRPPVYEVVSADRIRCLGGREGRPVPSQGRAAGGTDAVCRDGLHRLRLHALLPQIQEGQGLGRKNVHGRRRIPSYAPEGAFAEGHRAPGEQKLPGGGGLRRDQTGQGPDEIQEKKP